MTAVKRPPLRYFGGKFRMAHEIIQHFPSHKVYVEPFGGAAGVLMRKEPVAKEVYNDINDDVVNFFRVLRTEKEKLAEALFYTPYSRTEFGDAFEPTECPIERARRTAVRATMGFGSDAVFLNNKKRSGISTHKYALGRWKTYYTILDAAAERLRAVLIENRDAVEVMKTHDSAETLHYVDPPYMKDTRNGGKYDHEYTDFDHVYLLEVLQQLEGHVVVSGYDNGLYRDMLKDWKKIEFPARGGSAAGSVQRTEVLWIKSRV